MCISTTLDLQNCDVTRQQIFIKKCIGNLKKEFLTFLGNIDVSMQKLVDYQYSAVFTSYVYRKHEHKVGK